MKRISMHLMAVLVGGVLAAAGCTSGADGPIDYRVTGGLGGTGDGTVLHIELDGTTTRTVAGETETGVLDAATLADLRTKIAAAKFPALDPMYSCSCVDDFVNVISVQLDGGTHTVAADTTAEVPAALETVIDTLRVIYEGPLDPR